jgi:hypothetical protein
VSERLTTYEIACIRGGPERVAMVALAGLIDDGHVRLAKVMRRVTVLEGEQDEPVRAAVTAAVGALPAARRTLDAVLPLAAASEAVTALARDLRDRGLLAGPGPALSRRARAARSLRRRLEADLAADDDPLRRVAALGPAGFEDAALRQAFEGPGPDLRVPPLRMPGTSGSREITGGYNTPMRGD